MVGAQTFRRRPAGSKMQHCEETTVSLTRCRSHGLFRLPGYCLALERGKVQVHFWIISEEVWRNSGKQLWRTLTKRFFEFSFLTWTVVYLGQMACAGEPRCSARGTLRLEPSSQCIKLGDRSRALPLLAFCQMPGGWCICVHLFSDMSCLILIWNSTTLFVESYEPFFRGGFSTPAQDAKSFPSVIRLSTGGCLHVVFIKVLGRASPADREGPPECICEGSGGIPLHLEAKTNGVAVLLIRRAFHFAAWVAWYAAVWHRFEPLDEWWRMQMVRLHWCEQANHII